MKVTYNWLKKYIDFDFNSEQLVEKLTMLGLEVDDVFADTKDLEGIVVGQVLKKERHPNADKLSLCEVNIGSEILSIVCGAPNVEAGQKVPVAVEGAQLASGLRIKPTKIRGVESNGMICSEVELGLTKRADGIMVLDETTEVGSDFSVLVEKNDYIIDIDVTPNRPDCFGAIGIARDISALTGHKLKIPALDIAATRADINDYIKINILDTEKCPRYTARYIEKVKVKPSPLWLAKRLEQIGIRSINNIVDVTNYVMMETGQPLHAFDYDLLAGHEINVRRANDNEEFTTLDEKRHKLNNEILLICDKEKPIAIGGVMGGLNSEVSEKTMNILLESAYFNPKNIRRTSKFLGLATESSKRFERGVDPNNVQYALNRAAQLIAELSGGKIAKSFADEYPNKINTAKVRLRPERVALLLGIAVSGNRIKEILERLGCSVTGDTNFDVVVPTFRPDLTREADLIEEIARVYGYENIPTDTKSTIEQLGTKNRHEKFTNNIRTTLVSFGFSEVVTFNLIGQKQADMFLTDRESIRLLNPLSEDLSTLRTSIIPSLLNTLRWNINRSSKNIKFFEIGTVYQKKNGEVIEEINLTGLLTGKATEDSWKIKSEYLDIYDVKGIIQNLLNRNKIKNWEFGDYTSTLTNRNSQSLLINGKIIGCLGELNHDILESFSIDQKILFFDISINELEKNVTWETKFKPIPKFPTVERDLAVVVNAATSSKNIIACVQEAGGDLLKNVRLFDVYKGEQLGQGLKSLALNLTFYSLEKTLTEKDIEKRISKILESLNANYSAYLRS